MATLNENLTRLANARDDIADAIVAKGGTVGQNDGFEDFVDDIGSIPSAPTNIKNDVNIYDYDGTIIASYTKDQFLTLTEYPTHPDRTNEGLTSDGYNWDLNEAKTFVQNYGILEIGALYYPTSETCEIHLDIPVDDTYIGIYCGCRNNDYSSLSINWGDGRTTTLSTASNNTYSHYYNKGYYIITFKSTSSNRFSMSSSSIHGTIKGEYKYIKKIYLVNCSSIGQFVLPGYDIPICACYNSNYSNSTSFQDLHTSTTHLNLPDNFSLSNYGNITTGDYFVQYKLKTISFHNFSNTSTKIKDVMPAVDRITCNNSPSLQTDTSSYTHLTSSSFNRYILTSGTTYTTNINDCYLMYPFVEKLDLSVFTSGTLNSSYLQYCFNIKEIIFSDSSNFVFNTSYSYYYSMRIIILKCLTVQTNVSYFISRCPNLEKIYVPSSVVDTYKTTLSTYATIIEGF